MLLLPMAPIGLTPIPLQLLHSIAPWATRIEGCSWGRVVRTKGEAHLILAEAGGIDGVLAEGRVCARVVGQGLATGAE